MCPGSEGISPLNIVDRRTIKSRGGTGAQGCGWRCSLSRSPQFVVFSPTSEYWPIIEKVRRPLTCIYDFGLGLSDRLIMPIVCWLSQTRYTHRSFMSSLIRYNNSKKKIATIRWAGEVSRCGSILQVIRYLRTSPYVLLSQGQHMVVSELTVGFAFAILTETSPVIWDDSNSLGLEYLDNPCRLSLG